MARGRRQTSRRRLVVATAAVVAVAIALIASLAAQGSNDGNDDGDNGEGTDGSPRAQITAWQRDATTAFADAIEAIPVLVKSAHEWRSGSLDDERFAREVRGRFPQLVASRDQLARLEPLDLAEDTLSLYQDSSLLIVEMGRLLHLAVSIPPSDLREQIDRLAGRIKILGDRVFDRGQTPLDEVAATTLPTNIELMLPEEVPDWEAEGLAAGPPLDGPPPAPPPAEPPVRQDRRPEQSRDAWLEAVDDADIPTATELDQALDSKQSAVLATVARRFIAAAEKLRDEPDPEGDGGRELSARVRLSLLVYADAARAAEAATLLSAQPSAALERVVERLSLIADRIWSRDLERRRSGGDPARLRDDEL